MWDDDGATKIVPVSKSVQTSSQVNASQRKALPRGIIRIAVLGSYMHVVFGWVYQSK